MTDLTEWVGFAEILLGNSVLATGSCHLVVEKLRSRGATPEGNGHDVLTGARGTIRLDKGESVPGTVADGPVRIRLVGTVELMVDVHLLVPAAGFLAFTCSDVAGVERLLTREPPPQSA